MIGSFLNSTFMRFAQLKNCPDGVPVGSNECTTNLPEIGATSETLSSVLPVVFGIITAVAVLIIVIQGIKFVLSQGEPDKSSQARKGVIYAAVGLIIVFTADVFVAFFLKRII